MLSILLAVVTILNCLILFLFFVAMSFIAYDFYIFNKNDEERARANANRPRICAYCDNRIDEDVVEDDDAT